MRSIFLAPALALFIVFLAPLGQAQAADIDLFIEDISFKSVQPIANQTVKIIVRGKYVGDAPLTMNLGIDNVAFAHSDFKQESSPDFGSAVKPSVAYPLNSGSLFDYIFVGKFTSGGVKDLVFKIDGINNLIESNENNNLFNQRVTVLGSGDLIKITGDPAIYRIGSGGEKHLFVNGSTFWSYYTGNWSNIRLNNQAVFIKTLSQAAFDSIGIGKNMLVKTGARLIRFQNSSRIYTVFEMGNLKIITDEMGSRWYGTKWKEKVVTIQNSFESNYTRDDDWDFIDSDDDGLSDIIERNIYFTDPYLADTDGDSYGDGVEVLNNYNPNFYN